nr:unnamed protein product [Callosobruchus analis]
MQYSAPNGFIQTLHIRG